MGKIKDLLLGGPSQILMDWIEVSYPFVLFISVWYAGMLATIHVAEGHCAGQCSVGTGSYRRRHRSLPGAGTVLPWTGNECLSGLSR